MKKYYYIKCILDFCGALILLLIFWWLIVICMIIIKLDCPGDRTLYVDTRGGRNKKVFRMYKLRTMKTMYTGFDGVADHTLTGPGRIMRKFSLDELPQLINILNGTMSFVGPRPMPTRYLPYFTECENRRHEVRPGITGLAQVNGRANLNWDNRFAYDVEYVERMSFGLDMRIIFETIKKVVMTEDVIVAGNSEVTESFDDYRKKQSN
ncbi:MAG: sugar transferase [Christensenellales bacterium]